MNASKPKKKARKGSAKKLRGQQVVIHVPKGTGDNVRIEESNKYAKRSGITVRVAKNRKTDGTALLGVIVK